MSITNIRKRDGRTVEFDQTKIENAILRAFQASSSAKGRETAQALSQQVVQELENNESVSSTPTVEQVQDTVERVLIEKGFVRSAKAYILFQRGYVSRHIRLVGTHAGGEGTVQASGAAKWYAYIHVHVPVSNVHERPLNIHYFFCKGKLFRIFHCKSFRNKLAENKGQIR